MLTSAVETFDISIYASGLRGQSIELPGRLSLPAPPTGLVLFAHGSGSSRLSPRNIHVAGVLHDLKAGLRPGLVQAPGRQRRTDHVVTALDDGGW